MRKEQEEVFDIETDMKEFWFASLQKIRHNRKREIRNYIPDIKQLYDSGAWSKSVEAFLTNEEKQYLKYTQEQYALTQIYEPIAEGTVQFVTSLQEQYPTRLLPYEDAPYALFYKGELPREDGLTVGIVGARKCSFYGEKHAREVATVLGESGIEIISGMASGIDGISQRAALEVGGKSYGVLGCGVDVCYPKQHRGLYKDLCNHGGVIAEQPMGTQPLGMYFPMRNRIISGLSDILIIIEAKKRSGSLITADQAIEQGKEVYALPGNVDSCLSEGCNYLIKQGANVLLSPQMFLEEHESLVEKSNPCRCEKNSSKKIVLENEENLVYSSIMSQTKNITQIIEETNLPISTLINILVSLELKGYIREVTKNHYMKI